MSCYNHNRIILYSNILVYRDIDTYIKIIDSNADGQMSFKEMEDGLKGLRYTDKSSFKNLNSGTFDLCNILIIHHRDHCTIQPDHQLENQNCY